MNIEIDKNSGFCFGVVNAVRIAEEHLKKYGTLYSLGEIVHNRMEARRLEEMGMITITTKEFRRLRNTRVLIRAHGEPPETYRIARENNIELIDATCPVVSHLQKNIRTCYDEIRHEDGQVVIFGKPGHAEVVGLAGQTGNQAIIVENHKDLEKIDFTRPIYLYAQTTKSRKAYASIRSEIEFRLARNDKRIRMISHDTICRQVSGREEELKQFAHKHDLVVFVSGKNSSNGKQLFEVVKSGNPDALFISEPGELPLPLPGSPSSIGISGATSTPRWLMENIAEKIRGFYSS